MEKRELPTFRVPFEISGNRELFTGCISPTEFLFTLTKYAMDEDRRNWRSSGERTFVGSASEERAIISNLGLAIIRLPRSAYEAHIKQLSRSIHLSIRPLDLFTRMSECGYWILYQGDESGCKRAVERVEEAYLPNIENSRERSYLRNSLKVRLIMRMPGEPRNQWIGRIDRAYWM